MRVEGSGWRGPPDATALGRILVTIACLSIAAASSSSPPQGACPWQILPLPPRPSPRPHAPACPMARRCSSSAYALRPAVSSGPDLHALPAICVPDGMVCVLALCSPRRDGHVPTGARSLVASARATGCLPHRHVEDSAADPVWRAGAVSGLTAGVCSAEGQRPPASLLGRSWGVSCEPAAGLPDCIQGL